ncbi:MAG: DUF385 domain-containing protein [Acidimicrobiia bacterium]|nr:DUF385 domain-containing protein [Acidimicrobiia bacterium]
MAQTIEDALSNGGIIDITTTGRKTGQARRIEIHLHNLDGELYLTGRPGFRRDWVANLRANSEMTVHLKRGIEADLPARGVVVGESGRKGEIIHRARVESWNVDPAKARADLDHWIDTAPLVQVFID